MKPDNSDLFDRYRVRLKNQEVLEPENQFSSQKQVEGSLFGPVVKTAALYQESVYLSRMGGGFMGAAMCPVSSAQDPQSPEKVHLWRDEWVQARKPLTFRLEGRC
jgi:hypothetical protein